MTRAEALLIHAVLNAVVESLAETDPDITLTARNRITTCVLQLEQQLTTRH